MGVEFEQCFDQTGFAGPAGGRDDKQVTGIVHGARFWELVTSEPYSMFCTCSRICSISTFMSTEIWVSSSAADLEPMVLASRCSS